MNCNFGGLQCTQTLLLDKHVNQSNKMGAAIEKLIEFHVLCVATNVDPS